MTTNPIKIQPDSDFIHTAMCVWEAVMETLNSDQKSPVADYLKDRQETLGTASLRLEMIKLAESIERLYRMVGDAYDMPFDWHFVPDSIEGLFDSYGHLGLDEPFSDEHLLANWLDRGARAQGMTDGLMDGGASMGIEKKYDDLFFVTVKDGGEEERVNEFPNRQVAEAAIAAVKGRQGTQQAS